MNKEITMTTNELLACAFYLSVYQETDSFNDVLSKVISNENTVCEMYENLNPYDLCREIKSFADTLDIAVNNALAREGVLNNGGR